MLSNGGKVGLHSGEICALLLDHVRVLLPDFGEGHGDVGQLEGFGNFVARLPSKSALIVRRKVRGQIAKKSDLNVFGRAATSEGNTLNQSFTLMVANHNLLVPRSQDKCDGFTLVFLRRIEVIDRIHLGEMEHIGGRDGLCGNSNRIALDLKSMGNWYLREGALSNSSEVGE